MILVISRIAPDKQIENAIELAKILRERDIGKKGMIIVGNLHYYDYEYYQKLRKMIVDYNLSDYVSLQTNIKFSKLVQLMQLAKVYFHPCIDEHFGISIVEAMASGLVPVVSDIGGHTEFVAPKYHFHTLSHAADLINLAFEATTDSERLSISNSTSRFSNTNYIKSFITPYQNCQMIRISTNIGSLTLPRKIYKDGKGVYRFTCLYFVPHNVIL
jgi:alpha-1,2-mannosyltransferase